MKPRFVSFVAAEGVAIDQLSSRVTAFNMIDYVQVSALPTQFMRLSTISLYELGDEIDTFSERVRFVSPSGGTVLQSESAVSLALRSAREIPNSHRSVHALWRMKLEEAGDYRVVLERKSGEMDWSELSSVCITVIVQAHAIMNAQAAPVSIPAIPAADAGRPT